MKHQVRISIKQLEEAMNWCWDHLESDNNWSHDMGTFSFKNKSDAMAFRLSFDPPKTILMIDPPSGWQYKFPKPYNNPNNQSLEDWLLKNGYPQSLIDQDMVQYCRYFESEI